MSGAELENPLPLTVIEGVELKNVRGHEDARGGYSWAADIWLDGKKFGRVSNEGRGGPHYYGFEKNHKESQVALDVRAAVAASKGHIPRYNYEQTDSLMDVLGDNVETLRNLKKLAKTNIVYCHKQADGSWEYRNIDYPYDARTHSDIVKTIESKGHRGVVVLNPLLEE